MTCFLQRSTQEAPRLNFAQNHVSCLFYHILAEKQTKEKRISTEYMLRTCIHSSATLFRDHFSLFIIAFFRNTVSIPSKKRLDYRKISDRLELLCL